MDKPWKEAVGLLKTYRGDAELDVEMARRELDILEEQVVIARKVLDGSLKIKQGLDYAIEEIERR